MQCLIRAAVLAVAMLVPALAGAHTYLPDRIRTDRAELPLHANPLKPYLDTAGWRPSAGVTNTDKNARGYVSHWEISGDQLLLRDVVVWVWGETPPGGVAPMVEESVLGEVFPGRSAPIHASWYSGVLLVAEGKDTVDGSSAYGARYERYQLIRVREGMVIERQRMSGEEFQRYRAGKFEAFKQTDAYARAVGRLRGDDSTPMERVDRWILALYEEEILSAE